MAALILWEAFQRLSRARSYGAAGPNPIGFPEIEAWMRLTRTPLEPHHVEVIEAMDAVWLNRARGIGGAPDGVKIAPHKSAHKITPEMFDLAIAIGWSRLMLSGGAEATRLDGECANPVMARPL